MRRIKVDRLRTLRFSSNSRPRTTKNGSHSKSPKQGKTLMSKFHAVVLSQEKSPDNEMFRSKNSFASYQLNHVTSRPLSKLRVSTPVKRMKFLQRFLSTKSPETTESNVQEYTLGKFIKQFKHELTDYELGEVFSYKFIYYWGIFEEKLARAEINKVFDDEKGNLILYKRDHIAFRYEIIRLLGQGSFGQVCECLDHKDNSKVAVKIIKNSKNLANQAHVEIKILKILAENDPKNQQSILHIKDSFVFRNHICIVTELLGKNLYELQMSKNFCSFPMSLIKKFAIQILNALKFLESLKIIHCDIKPENLLLMPHERSKIKIADFGSSCLLSEKIFTYIQSRFYRAPEVLLGINYGCGIDMWSLGCVLVELANGKPLFPADCERELLQLIMQVKGFVPPDMLSQSIRKNKFFNQGEILPDKHGNIRKPLSLKFSEMVPGDYLFLDFVEKCLEWEPWKRMTPEEALEHSWIKTHDTENMLEKSLPSRLLRRKPFLIKK